ncbi:PREDICTED: auxin response factor 16-like isoform X1 [Nicotiana attenuata]|uniref:Auxin response factor n=1 Tax=Nicotiana attenuata TaxID=49451 RepID=A0A1J6K8F5_NICAT|nr:PREDICTED: auxin response factor 16-like isoform X1 [Nicotiana attenuata]XP_019235545.1 PREDICTED: auxin response factor 16-like isoform X1 [Nicotiana attenuata]OIT25622.1 auxin response factor 18 [Nicotiana attenuata]
MINIMNPVNKPMNEVEKGLDPQLWHACAGGMVQMPPLNSKAFYFPQGHAEHAHKNVDFGGFPKIPPLTLCRVSSIRYLADTETDEVYAKIRLVPLKGNECDVEDDAGFLGLDKNENQEKPNSFAKTLTQSDANNGGGFSVPRYCAETIFPRLDYSAEPPVQTILAKDVHGEVWKFRHIYRGTPRRHLLTTGWSNFVNQKKLVAGDSIVFLRAENGDLCVGIRRAKRGIGSGPEVNSGWNTGPGNYASSLYHGFPGFLSEDEKKFIRNGQAAKSDDGIRGKGKVRAESVIEAAKLAACGQPFEVVYYPRASTPEFVVKASAVRAAMRVQWSSGMRFKMPFETEDSSRISWFMGTISSVHVEDPIHWPNSPWRLLQVHWDEPDLLQNVKRVSPWLVELVSNMPPIHLSPFSPPRKKLRLPQPPEFPMVGQLSMSSLLNNPLSPSSPLCCISDNIPAGIQGARHAQCGLSSSDIHFNKLQAGLLPFGFKELERSVPPSRLLKGGSFMTSFDNDENISCLLTMGNTSPTSTKRKETQTPTFMLFGKPILTKQQMSLSCSSETVGNSSSNGNPEKMMNLSEGSGSAVIHNGPPENSSGEVLPWYKDQKLEFRMETGHCKVFMESDDVGRTLDLSVLGSYEELYKKLADMFGVGTSEMLSNVLYQDLTGAVKHTGDEPFSQFVKTARRLTILTDSGSDNIRR